MGKVYLIGAGPGDEKLVTLKAADAVKEADVLFYDRLAPKSLLRFAKDDCEIYYCGKTPGNHYKKQDEINEMLIKAAKEGHTVGRVKGGDPYIFGRGGEEALALKENGIEFETISGVTSFVSVLNYAGIPVTHRGLSQSFHVFTGMSAERLNIDWDAVSRLSGTLIFMMGLSNIEIIQKRLLDAGKDENTLAAVIMKGTTSKQKKVVGKLKDISKKAAEAELESPCIIVFGEVVNLEEELDWHIKKPLSGLNICITRSKEQAGEMREKLYSLGAEVTEINAIKTEKIEGGIEPFIKGLDFYDYIILNSVNAIEFFFDEIIERNIDIRRISAKFPAIGEKTADALKKRGIVPYITAEKFTLEGLYEALENKIRKGEKALFPKSENGRDYLVDKFRERGLKADSFDLYRTVCGDRRGYEDLEGVDIIVFTSPSTFKNTVKMFGIEEVREKKIIAIGPITAKAVEEAGLRCEISRKYSVEGIIDKIIEMKNKNKI